MTNEEAIDILTKGIACQKSHCPLNCPCNLECENHTSGTDIDCNLRNCDECELCYAQGTTGEQREALKMAIEALHNSPTQMSGTSDLISRQAAYNALVKHEESDGQHNYSMFRSVVSECEEIILDLPFAQPKQQWIPCSERLPDKEGQYLVTDEAGGVVSIICDVFFHYDDGSPTWLLSQNVVAWMPLPEPYRESEG